MGPCGHLRKGAIRPVAAALAGGALGRHGLRLRLRRGGVRGFGGHLGAGGFGGFGVSGGEEEHTVDGGEAGGEEERWRKSTSHPRNPTE